MDGPTKQSYFRIQHFYGIHTKTLIRTDEKTWNGSNILWRIQLLTYHNTNNQLKRYNSSRNKKN